MGLRLAQEKALKRQLEEEQKLKPGSSAGAGAGVGPTAVSTSTAAARPGPLQPPEEALDFREEGPECETPGIFISVDDDSGLTEAALLDSSLEGPLPKVARGRRGACRWDGGPGRDPPPTACPVCVCPPQEAAAGSLASKEERSPQTLTPAAEDPAKTPSPAAPAIAAAAVVEDAASAAGDPEAKASS